MAVVIGTDKWRRKIASMAAVRGNQNIGKLAASNDVSASTIRNWQKRFGIQVHKPTKQGFGESPVATDVVEQDADPSQVSYESVAGALPPDNQTVAYWRTMRFLDHADSEDTVIFGPIQIPDGRHAAAFAVAEHHPRDGSPSSGAGTFAIVGEPGSSAADSEHWDDRNSFGRPTFWRDAPQTERLETAVAWMVHHMANGTAADADDPRFADAGYPSFEQMSVAATLYQDRTGDYAFPIYIEREHSRSHYDNDKMEVHILDPRKTEVIQHYNVPAGFAIMTKKELEDLHGEVSWDIAYEVMDYAGKVFNDNAQGKYIEAVIGVFSSDADMEPFYHKTPCIANEDLIQDTRDRMTMIAEEPF